jgi:hypothetical protein
MDEQGFWVVTASADHAAHGLCCGIVQAGHGKAAPLRRMHAGDGVVIYSPRTTYPDGPALQAFTAIGRVTAAEPWVFDMGAGFRPWRRGVDWQRNTVTVPIRPMLADLDLTRGQASWGMAFRYGLRALTAADFAHIERAMRQAGQGHSKPDEAYLS